MNLKVSTNPGGQAPSLKDLQSFLDTAGAKSRVLGEKDAATGEIRLYTSDKRSSLRDVVTGKAAQRRADAREAVGLILDKHQQKTEAKGLTQGGRDTGRLIFSRVADRLNAKPGQALRSGQLATLVGDAKDSARILQRNPSGPLLAQTGLQPGDLTTLRDALVALPRETGNEASDAFLNLAEGLGTTIGTGFATASSAAEKKAFAMSDGSTMRGELKAELKRMLPENTLTDAQMNLFTAAAFNTAAATVSPDKALPVQQPMPASLQDVPPMSIGGQVYSPVQHLATAGFAKVYRYEAANGDQIAVKIPTEGELGTAFRSPQSHGDLSKTTLAQAREAVTHSDINGGGHPNIVDIKGAVRLPDGRIATAMELAPNGDLDGLKGKISAAVGTGPGKISAAQADVIRLTAIKDVCQGLKQVRDAGYTHLDFKPPNCLIGADGVARVADFGTGVRGASVRAGDIPDGIDNPTWQAPEMLHAKAGYKDAVSDIGQKSPAARQAVTQRLARLLGRSETELAGFGKTVAEGRERADLKAAGRKLAIDGAADTWGLGISAAQIMGVELPFEASGFMSAMEDQIKAYGRDQSTAPALQPANNGQLGAGAIGKATGVADVDALINGMLDRRPDQRSSLSDVLAAPALNRKGVGHDAAHLLIAALASGDAADIDYAKGRLAALML